MEQGTTEQVHRGNIQAMPRFLAPRRGSCCERRTTTASTPGQCWAAQGEPGGSGNSISPPCAHMHTMQN